MYIVCLFFCYIEPSNELALTTDAFPALRDSILTLGQEGQILEVVGQYFEEETNETDYESLGEARAFSVKQLFLENLDGNRIKISSEALAGDLPNVSYLEHIDFRWVEEWPFVSRLNQGQVQNNFSFDYFKSLILSQGNEDRVLLITGHYLDEESNPGDAANWGLIRAVKM